MVLPRFKDLFSRRDLFRTGGLAAAAQAAAPLSAGSLKIGPDIYASIGVRPVINCRGTLTIISGSQTLAEVKRAMEEASRHYVHLDELMEAVGKRLAEITGAEWGIVTSGCAAALAHITAACVAGTDPEKIKRLPDTTGLNNEVILPSWCRNEYDHSMRMVGIRLIEVTTKDDYLSAFTPRTALVVLMAQDEDNAPFKLPFMVEAARARGVPVVVDAAAEDLTIPNVHLARGATAVCYSGGKAMRGPQCAGLALGNKELLRAAWINSAPHHTFGRPMKVGKEEIVGMLAAVEMWVKRDHAAEWRQKEAWLERIASAVSRVPGVKTEMTQPRGLSNRSPRLRIEWDPEKLGITGGEVERILYEGSPRIDLGPSNYNRDGERNRIGISAHMMMPGDAEIVAERLYAVLSNPPQREPEKSAGQPAAVAGPWQVHLEFLRGKADHFVVFEQHGNELAGTHHAHWLRADLKGVVQGEQVRFRSSGRFEGNPLVYNFSGRVSIDAMDGTCRIGEYGTATFTARRHRYA